jgi:hypothetical protein
MNEYLARQFPFSVTFMDRTIFSIHQWCEENCSGRFWFSESGVVRFDNSYDALMFRLWL